MLTSDLGTVSADAVPFSTTAQGAVLVDSAQYYTTPLSDAWEYVQDLSLVATGRAPRFASSRASVTPEVADVLLSNATATIEAQILAGGPAAAENLMRSMNEFVESGGTLEGLEIPYFSAAMTLRDQPDMERLLDDSARAFLKAGGLDGVFGSLEALASGRFRTNDIFPILDAASGQLGLPAVSDVVAAIGAAGDIFKNPEQFAAHAGEALEAVVHGVKAPGHRLFSSVSHTLAMISPSVGEAFRDFRHSDVGKFVETVGSVALGIGMVVAAPAAAAIKAGVHVVEGAVAFFKGVWHAIFDSDDDRHPADSGTPAPTPDVTPGAGGHPLSDEDKKKIKEGTHAVVGCWVAEPMVIPEGPIRRKPQDGSCPEPDLTQAVPFPSPDPQGAWPSTPQPRVSGPGILALMNDLSGSEPLSFEFDGPEGFSLEFLGSELGWDERAAVDLASTLERLGHEVPDELASFARRAPAIVISNVSAKDALAVFLGREHENTRVLVLPVSSAESTAVAPRVGANELSVDGTSFDLTRAATIYVRRSSAEGRSVPDITAELDMAERAVLTEYAYAVGWGLHEPDPLALSERAPSLEYLRVPNIASVVDELLLRVRA